MTLSLQTSSFPGLQDLGIFARNPFFGVCVCWDLFFLCMIEKIQYTFQPTFFCFFFQVKTSLFLLRGKQVWIRPRHSFFFLFFLETNPDSGFKTERSREMASHLSTRTVTRSEILGLYKRMLKVASSWEEVHYHAEGGRTGGKVHSRETNEELYRWVHDSFRSNKEINDLEQIQQLYEDGEKRLGLALHYGTTELKKTHLPPHYSADSLNKGIDYVKTLKIVNPQQDVFD